MKCSSAPDMARSLLLEFCLYPEDSLPSFRLWKELYSTTSAILNTAAEADTSESTKNIIVIFSSAISINASSKALNVYSTELTCNITIPVNVWGVGTGTVFNITVYSNEEPHPFRWGILWLDVC